MPGADVCPQCAEPRNAGLCTSCAERDRAILPQLREPSWYEDVHSGMYWETGKNAPSADAQKVRDRRERKRVRRMQRLVAGDFSPARPRATAA